MPAALDHEDSDALRRGVENGGLEEFEAHTENAAVAGVQTSVDAQCACGPGQKRVETPRMDAGAVLATADARVSCDDPVRADSDARTRDAGDDQVGRIDAVTQSASADLDLLHATLGHYARQLLDIQKVRVAMGNRAGAMARDGIPPHLSGHATATVDGLAKLEADLNRYLERSARRHPLAPWIKEQRGIGLPGFARLLGITGSLARFATVSKLWAYLGLHVVDGSAPRRQKGERANWSPQGRVLCHQIGESIVRAGSGHWRAVYDQKKAVYETDRPEWTQARRHNAAMRYAVKMLLKAMWLEWRRVTRKAVS